ncbi:MAG TPA: type IV secretion system DNA-binding domain-containing protein [Steroidobacteraceae bacterium]|nr:type IV secretion system DNA-binding domain-containing protein [Steroidobacteraceae bacterium]
MLAHASVGALMHGWSGLALAYASIQAPMLAAMIRARADLPRLLLSPVVAAPLTAVAGAGLAAVGPLSQGMALLVGGTLSAALGYATGRALGAPRRRALQHQRGTMVVNSERAEAPTVRGAQGATHRSARTHELTLAGLAVATADETKHFKLIGTTGTGKSTAICELLGPALRRGDRAVIADPDGGYLRRYFEPTRGDVLLNPFDQRSVKWDLFGEIQQPYDVEQLARSLLPDQEAGDRSWHGYARTFLTAVTRQAHAAGIRDVGELYRLLVIAPTAELRALTAGTPAQPFLEQHNGRMFDSIRSVASSAVASLEHIAQQQGPAFSIRQWVKRGQSGQGGVLFIPYRADQIAALRSTVSAWMRIAIFETMAGPEADQRLWFAIDELDALGPIDGLKDALARVRKFGGRCILGLQSIAQVASTYGAGDAHTIVENCGNTLILRCSASEGGGTSRFASTLIGQREVLRTTRSRTRGDGDILGSVTRSEQFSIEPAVMDSEIEQLPDLAGYLKFASGEQWFRVSLPRLATVHRGEPDTPAFVPVSRSTLPTARAEPEANADVPEPSMSRARRRPSAARSKVSAAAQRSRDGAEQTL